MNKFVLALLAIIFSSTALADSDKDYGYCAGYLLYLNGNEDANKTLKQADNKAKAKAYAEEYIRISDIYITRKDKASLEGEIKLGFNACEDIKRNSTSNKLLKIFVPILAK